MAQVLGYKSIELTDKDLFNGFECPICGKHYSPNGTGPANLGFVASFLKWIPSELFLGGIPARFHDCAYLLCKDGWRVLYRSTETMEIAWNKETADETYLFLMWDQVKDAKGPFKALARLLSHRNYLFVRLFGKKSYGHVSH